MKTIFRLSTLSALIIGTCTVPQALASGYHFGTQSVSVQATSNASSVEANSPATIFYNPAGLSKLEGTQVTGNLITALPEVKYKNAKGQYFPGQPIKGKDSGSITDSVIFVPHVYASHEFTPQLTGGIGLYVPFGAGTHYEDDSIMRYSVQETELKTINIHPSIAYDFQNGHSIGGGVIAQYIDAGLAKTVDFGPSLRGALPSPLSQMVHSGDTDVTVDIKGDDWGFGYNLGWMWDINKNARVGVTYRSKIKHTLKGDAKWTPVGSSFNNQLPIPVGASHNIPAGKIIAGAVRKAGYLAEEGASVNITTPESISLQGMVKVNPQLDLFGDVTWTRHSRFNELNVRYENRKSVPDAQKLGGRTTSDVTMLKPNWRDTYKVSAGAAYQLDDHWQLRGGVSYDQSPVRNPQERLSTMPDNDRLMFSLGTQYKIDDNQAIDVAYTYIHIKDAEVDSTGYCGTGIKAGPKATNCVSDRTASSAEYDSNAHFIGLQYTYRF